jgi:hypothetical protein
MKKAVAVVCFAVAAPFVALGFVGMFVWGACAFGADVCGYLSEWIES